MHLLFTIALLAAPLGGLPADTVSAEAALPEVSVVATRLATVSSQAPSRVTVLDAAAMASSASRDVASLMEARSAAFVRRYGPAGLASISLRGTGAAQTLILLDGHRIADPQLGQLDLSLLPTILLERVEIMHGAGSALHGTDGIGGVVDLRTLRPDGRRVDAVATAGAFGERRASGRVALGDGPIRAMVAAEGSMSDGDFPFFNPRLGASGEMARRSGADSRLASLFARAEADVARTTAFAAVWAGDADRGTPGSVGAPTDARQRDRHLRMWGGATTRFGWGTLRTGGLLQRAALRYNADEGRTWLSSAEAEARIPAGVWLFASGMTAGLGSAKHPSLAEDAREGRFGAFVAATGDYGRLLLYPALRADVYLRTGGATENLAALSPRLGANLAPLANSPLRLKAGFGGAFRAPTFNDRFWRYADPSAPAGDPDLRPERGWSSDLGAFTQVGPLHLEVTGYASWLRDQIVWHPAGGGFYSPRNIGRTRTLGLEVTTEAKAVSMGPMNLTGGLTYALTDARDRSDPGAESFDRQLRYVPRHQVKTHASGTLRLSAKATALVDISSRYVSARPVRSDGTLDQPPYVIADGQLRISYAFDAGTGTLGLGVENILDADYAVLRGYPMPPRHARITLHLSF